MTEPRAPSPPPAAAWEALPDEKLLDLRLGDLGLNLRQSRMTPFLVQIRRELRGRRLRFRPHFWISDEWFSPDGVPGIAIPFYLAHPRLMRLEERQMLEVEGADPEECLRILRHEVGHALDNAYRLHRRQPWRRIFGRFSQKYPDHYQPRPYSKKYVQHLASWYAQSHPAEDFAETFAVWLAPGDGWRQRYAGWPALRKLQFVDSLMAEIGSTLPRVRSRARVDVLKRQTRTLREHYEAKRDWYVKHRPEFYDADLRRLFSDAPEHVRQPPAWTLLNRLRPEIRRAVARGTGEYQYTVDQALKAMVGRCRDLRLRVHRPVEQVRLEATILLTVQTMNFLHSGHHRVPL